MTRAEFLSLFERYLKRADLADIYADFLLMTEARINAMMRLPEMEIRATSTPKEAFWLLPDDWIELRHIQAAVNGGPRPLEYVTPEQADLKRRLLRGNYGAAFYTIVDNALEVIPHPTTESETELEIFYYAKVPPLVNDADTNLVVTNYPNLYLYGMLAEAALYRESQELASQWLSTFMAYANDLNTRGQSARFGGNSMQMRAV